VTGVRVRLHSEIRAGVERIARVLAGLGHTVSAAQPRYRLMGLALLCRGEAGVHEWVRRVPDRSLLDRRTLETARLGGVLSRRALPLARRLEPRMARRLRGEFEEVDVLIAPTTASPPLAIGAAAGLGSWGTQRQISAACPYAWPWNVLGWPAISVPAGLTADGLPFGVQLIGPANSEATLLALAAQLERVERWHERLAPYLVETTLA
jgi:amidase